MAYQDTLAAMNLEMTGKVPRTEYSAHCHWPLVEAVTGIKVDADSSDEARQIASSAFLRAWDYGTMWNIDIHSWIFGERRTSMGHAVYAANGADFVNDIKQLFSDPEDVFSFDMEKEFGKRDKKQITAHYDKNYDRLCEVYPDCVNMSGVYVTCMSGVLELLGWDTLLMASGIDSAAFGSFMNRYVDWIAQYFEALADCKSKVVMIHDDITWTSGGFLHPDFYRTYIFPNYHKLFRPLLDSGKKILFTSDGNYSEYIDDIAAAGVNGFVMEPCTDMKYIAEKYGKTHIFIGNADTRILLSGTRDDIEAEVKRCMDIGKQYPGFIMAVGNHIPINTPVENALYYNEMYEKYARR